MKKWTRALYQPNLPLTPAGYVTAGPGHIALSRRAAREGMVLLKNDNALLPLDPAKPVALVGKAAFDYVKGGGGSGDVTVAYVKNLYDGLKEQGVAVDEPLCSYYRDYTAARYAAGDQPGMMAEPEVPHDLLAAARKTADTAVVVLSRFSGEGWDRSDVEFIDPNNPWPHETSLPQIAGKLFPKGDFYRSDAETAMVEAVCALFDRVVLVLNVGGVMDVSWFKDDSRIGAALMAYQGGMEGGCAAAELLTGKASPCGKLPDTYARSIDDWPSTAGFLDSPWYVEYTEDIYVGYRYFNTLPGAAEKVCYGFGYGLSYTTFDIKPLSAGEKDGVIHIAAQVTNTGAFPAKEVVQVYYSAPQGKLQKPARVLAAFHKTAELAPGESETAILSFPVADMASFDDLGKVQAAAWVMEAGVYKLYLGNSLAGAKELDFAWEQSETAVTEQLQSLMAPSYLKERLLADGTYEPLPAAPAIDTNATVLTPLGDVTEAVAPAVRGRERYLLMKSLAEGAKPLSDVAEGKLSLDDFLAQLSDRDLIHLLGGQPNTSVSNTFGIGNLPEYGVPDITTADGPAGLRVWPETGVCTTAWPCATLLAATWDRDLTRAVGAAAAEEVKENNIAVWLAPAVNIHRNPLCGRNFEYWSEDPLLAGTLAGAMVKGIQSQHVAATVKHFACNDKETNRKNSDSRLSQRALREIYLKAFEIIVRTAQPWAIMTSYNIINGCRASESRELLTDILRGEWGYQGMVMTDWWNNAEHYKEVLAGNDLKMATGYPERLQAALDKGAISRADLLACAKRVLELILKID